MKDISIVIPVMNEEQNIKPMYDQTVKVLKALKKDYEIIYVDDGSKDKTFEEIKKLNKADKNVRAIRFRRNFGKAAGLSAGFEMASGDIVITMDGDLQDEPEEIPKFLEVMDKGYDFVTGWKVTKHKESMLGLRKLPSLIFNRLAQRLTGLKIHDFNCPFKAYRNDVVKDLILYGEMHRYIPALAHWKGYKIAEIKVLNYPRKFGKTKYGTKRILKGLLDLVTVKFLSSYQNRPLHLFGFIGITSGLFGGVAGLYLFSQWVQGISIGSRPLLMLAVLLVVLGMQFGSIGLLGEMMTLSNKTSRHSYSIKEKL